MKKSFTIILILLNLFLFAQELIVPVGYEIRDQVMGDLDKDGIDEKVIVYNIKDTTNAEKSIREIQILKSSEGSWKVWKKSRNAIQEGLDGAFDPNEHDDFESIDITDGMLIISHSYYPKALDKWRYVDTYRFQNNDFELVAHHSFSLLAFEYIVNWDFNTVTGRIEYKKEFIDNNYTTYKTEEEIFYKKDVKVSLGNRYLKNIKIRSPKYKKELGL
ncbi:hypothetical protein [Aquimarina litoralis]|uniref:hypothetical protein n=1 Tax=Aquimarina litoralis TaxID=584605 RepID=UPI001C578899|nr:hypothetical protein [Aquimarina litoralis]MBW1295724.1 hypothetical protein [Aquimarina litoralis]